MKNLTLLFASLLLYSSATATVKEVSKVTIPYQTFQSEKICLHKQLMIAEYGIPLASLMEGIFSESIHLNQILGGTSVYENLNLLTTPATIDYSYVSDSYSAGVWIYEFDLDFAQINSFNGLTVEGRQKTINKAKLAIIAIVNTAIDTHGSAKFKVWLNLKNLPHQKGLTGKAVYSTTSYPYTSSSPLVAIYQDEVLSNSCP